MSVPIRLLGARVLIRADRETRAPVETDSGVVLAETLAAAVEGEDAQDSWYVGTVVQLGPLAKVPDIRPWVRQQIRQIFLNDQFGEGRSTPDSLRRLLSELDALPRESGEPLKVGDRVCFSWASGQAITIDGDRYVILMADEILAALDQPEAARLHASA